MNHFAEEIISRVSGAELLRHVTELVKWDRTSGTKGEYAAVDYIAETLRDFGLPVTVHEFRSYLSHPVSGALQVVLDGTEVPMQAKTRAFSANTPVGGVTGEIVSIIGGTNMFASDGAVSQISAETVGGRIVLSESGSRGTMLAAQEAGAIGYVHMWPSAEPVLHEGIVTNVWGTPTPEVRDRVPTIPIITITNGDGTRIRKELATGPVRGTMHSETRTGWSILRMPVTELAGDTDDFVLVAGHVDSWHLGATDNATGNAACLELARIFSERRDSLRRGIRIAWWVGHSTGRYSGSAWYADNFWHELDDRCVAYINIDSPGSLGATDYGTVTAVPETAALVTESVQRVTGQTPLIARPLRAGDQSFWGIGLPSLYMLLSNRPEGKRAAVGGCGMGWWWHTEEDLLDKVDEGVLVKDTQIYAHSLALLVNERRLPLDVAAQVRELERILQELQTAAGTHLSLAHPIELAAELLSQLERAAGSEQSEEVLRCVNHLLTALLFTSGDRFDHDPAIPADPLPSLAPARLLSQLEPNSDDYGFLVTRLVRNRNMVVHKLTAALQELEREH